MSENMTIDERLAKAERQIAELQKRVNDINHCCELLANATGQIWEMGTTPAFKPHEFYILEAKGKTHDA